LDSDVIFLDYLSELSNSLPTFPAIRRHPVDLNRVNTASLSTDNSVLNLQAAPALGTATNPTMGWGRSSSLLFVDTRVSHYQSLIAGVKAGTEVHILDPLEDAIAQITNTLLGRDGIESLQIVSHGAEGGLLLGNSWVDQTRLQQSADQLASWANALTQDADILIYGCDVASGEMGQAFVQILSQLTSADVAASHDLTGNAAQGGDWELEVQTGAIGTQLAFQADVLQAYQSVFITYSSNQTLSTTTLNENVTIAGDITLNVSGNFTIGNGFNIAGNGGAPDSLTIKSTGTVSLGANLKALGLEKLTIEAKNITLLDGVDINLTGDLSFSVKDTAVNIPIIDLSGDVKTATIAVGKNVKLQAGSISLAAKAADESFLETVNKYVGGAIVKPLLEYGEAIAALPVGLVIRKSTANISIGDNSQLITDGDVDIASNAVADATSKVLSRYFSIGWSDATASATTQIGQGVVITATGDVNIAADASAKADMTTRTLKDVGVGPADNSGIAVSIAVANADLTSKTTIAQGAKITAGRNANVLANGKVERSASAEAGAFKDGRVGASGALGFTKSDVQAIVNGEITSGTTIQKSFNPALAVNASNDTIAINSHGFKNGQAIVYSKGDGSDLGGLEDGTTYFVIKVDDNTIKLAESAADVEESKAIDLKNSGVTGTAHQLKDPGIRVVAKLESEDKADATSGVGGELSADDKISKPEVAVGSIFDALTKNNAQNDAGKGGSGAAPNFAAAAALAFSKVSNNVAATIGTTGVLKSAADLYVQATIENKLQTASEASSEVAEGASANANAASAAVIVGLYSNTAKATIGDGAKIDARQTTSIASEVTYPFLVDFKKFLADIPGNTLKSLDDKLKEDGIFGFADYLDGTLGIKSTLINSWAKSTAKGNNLSLAGSINFQKFTSDTQAIIGTNAEVNQDIAYQSDAQTVSVEAKTDLNQINITGIFDFELSLDKLKELYTKIKDKLSPQPQPQPEASDTAKGGIGGALFLMLNDSTTIAKVNSGAKVRTGTDGSLDIKAASTNIDINFAQSGANGGKFGVAGTFAYTSQESETIAQLASGTTVTGGALTVNADDESTRVNLVGGVSKSTNLGVGMSISIHEMDRTVDALIGNQTGAAGIGTDIQVSDIGIKSQGRGGLWSFSLAAAVVSKDPKQAPGSTATQEPPAQPDAASDDPLDGLSLPALFGETPPAEPTPGNNAANTSNDKGNQGKTGIGIAGDVAINFATDRVRAFINDAGSIKGEKLTLDAINSTELRVASGSAAFVASDPSKKSVGIAGSFSLNTLTGTTSAFISGTSGSGQKLQLEADQITVNAIRTGSLIALSASGSGAPGKDGIAIAGSVSVNRITNSTQAYIDGVQAAVVGAVLLDAKDTSNIFAIGGAVGFGGKAGFGAGVAVNLINNSVKANLNNATLAQGQTLTLNATNSGAIRAITASVGISPNQGGIGGAGTVSVNNITLNTEASITGTTRTTTATTATDAIALSAKNTAIIQSLAGAVGFGNTAGFGAAVGYNGITNNTNAFISNSNLTAIAGTNLTAESSASIQSITLGVGGGKDVGLGGSVAINLIRGGTRAYINSNSTLTAGGQINLSAKDTSTIEGLSGGIAGSPQNAAIGAALSVNDITTTTTSYIEQSNVTSSNAGVSAIAEGRATIKAVTVGAAGAGKVAIGGSVSVNLIRNTVDSHIGNAAVINAAQTVEVKAIEASTLEASGGALAGAGTAAVAGALVVNDIENQVNAKIISASVTSTQGSVIVSADSRDSVQTISVGGSIGGKVGVAGSVSVSMMGNTVAAEITGSTVIADDNVLVLANSQNTISFYGGTLSVGGAAGVGGSANVNTVSNITRAVINGNSNVTAKGNASISVPKADASNQTELIQGVAVVATNSEKIDVWTANIAGGGKAGVAGTASVTVIESQTIAAIDTASVNANNTGANINQGIKVRAFNSTDVDVKAGTAAIGGAAGVGATVDVTVIGTTTQAFIRNAPIVNANQGGVEVSSFSREKLSSMVASGSGGFFAGVAGSILVSDIRSNNAAYISGSTVNTFGSLRVIADDKVDVTAVAGAVGVAIKGAGVGATIGVVTVSNTTSANITNSTTNASGTTEVKANSVETISTGGASLGAALFAGVAGTTLVSSLTTRTIAAIDGTSRVNQNLTYRNGAQNVRVDAQNQSTLNGGVAALGGGIAGFGASVMVSGIWNTTSAAIGDGATVSAGGNIAVNAFSEKTVNTAVIAFAGGAVGVAGAVSVVNIGTGMSSDGTSAVSSTQSETDGQTNKSQVENQLGSSSFANRAKSKADSKTNGMKTVGFGSTSPVLNGTSAYIGIGAVVNADGNIDVTATERITLNQGIGNIAVGAVGVGGSVAIANINGNTQAFIANGATVNAGGNLNITADFTDNLTSIVGAGQGGLVGLGAQVVIVTDNSSQLAAIGNATINQAGNIQVNARANRTSSSTMVNLQVGGYVAGVAVTRTIANGSTQALVGDNAQIGQLAGKTVGSLTVSADSNTTATARAYSLSVGIGAAASANVAQIEAAPSISAQIGAGADIKTSGGISLTASGTASVLTDVFGINAGTAAIGASFAKSQVTPTLTTSVGNDAVLEAGAGILLDSRFNVDANGQVIAGKEVSATANSSGGGLLSGNGADANAITKPTLNTTIGDRANLKAGGDIKAIARSTTNTIADAQGNSYGAVAVGVSLASANETVNTHAFVGGNARLEGQNLLIWAKHYGQQVKATATSSSGGLIGGVGSDATARTNTTVSARTGSNAALTGRGNVDILSQSTNVADAYASGKAFGIAAGGLTSARAEITNTNTADIGAGTQVNAGGNVTISAQSDNKVARAEAIGGAGGILSGASTSGTAIINDNTKAEVGDNARITALNGTTKVEALASNEAHSRGNIETGGAVTSNTTEATSNVISHIRTEIGDGAQLLSKQIQLHAKGTKLDVDADAYSKTAALDSTTRANSNLNIDVDTKVTNYTGASLNGENRLEIISRLDGVDTDSKAKSEIAAGLTGSVFATAHNDLKLDADVDIQTQSKISSSDIFIEAKAPQDRNNIYGVDPETVAKTVVNYILTAVEEVVKVVSKIPVIGWFVKWVTRTVMKLVEQILDSAAEAKRSGAFHSYNTINLGGDIYQGAPSQASLLINPDLSMVTQGGISAQIVGNEVIVSDVTTKPPGQIVINSEFGSVTGNAIIHKNSVLEIVDIINNSTKDLRINRIKTINNAVESPDLEIRTDSNTAQITTVTDVLGTPRITVQNNTASNVIFAGVIENATGSFQVTNQGGHILTSGNVQLENANANISAIQGRVGDLTNRLNLRLFDDTSNAALQANAGQGIYLNTQLASNQLGNGLTLLDGLDFNSITAGQDIDITVQAADIYQFNLETFVLSREPIDGIYNLKNVSSTQGNVKVAFNQGTVNIGKIQAQAGIVNLGTTGQLVDANTNGADITSQSAILSATAGIGSSGNALDTAISRLEAIGSSGLYVNNTGNLAIGGISALVGIGMTGDISLVNAGSVTINENVIASGAVQVTATDTTNPGENIEIAANTRVESTTNGVSLLAGDNFTLNLTGAIAAATQITINGDFGNADAGVGSTIDLRGTMTAPTVTVLGNSDNDTINLTNVVANAPVSIQSQGGDDLIRIGSQSTPTSNTGGTVNSISALLTIDGGSGADQLQVDETGDVSDNTGVLTQNSITGLGMSNGIQYSALETVEINLGSGSDSFTIASTHNGTSNLNTNAGQDTIQVQTIAGATTVNSGSDDDQINVGNTNQTVNQINALLTVAGGLGNDRMNVNDVSDTSNNTGTLTQNTVTGLGMSNGIQYGELEVLDINLGSGSDSFTIASTHNGTSNLNTNAGQDTIQVQTIAGATTVNSGSDDDQINVGNTSQTVNQINALLTVAGGLGNDRMNVNDVSDTSNNTGTLTQNTVTGLGMSDGIQYGELEVLDINLGSGSDNFTIASTHSGISNLNTNAGQDTIQVQTIAGATTVNSGSDDDQINVGNTSQTVNQINALLTVAGGLGSDRMNVNDSGDTTDNTGISTQNTVTGLGMSDGIQYGELEVLDINLGSGSDSFTIASTHNGTTNLNTNAGQDTIQVQTIAGATNVNAGSDDDQINVGNTNQTVNQINALLTVAGGLGNDRMNVNDSGDTTDNSGISTQNTVTGLGMSDGIQYGELEVLDINLGSGSDNFTIASTHTGATTVNAAAGQDTINAQSISGATTVNAGTGDDTVNAALVTPVSSGVFVANGDDGNDTLNAAASTLGVILNGDAGNDTIQGGAGNDQIAGGAGDDTIDGNAGNDTILGDSTFQRTATTYTAPVSLTPAGNDSIQGGAGRDTIYGEGGDDVLIGGSLEASEADTTDYIFGGAGNDTIAGDNATVNPATRTITLQGTNGDADYIFGDQGTLTLADGSIVSPINTTNALVTKAESASALGDGDDVISGGMGQDALFGGAGADQISGNQGDDRILGDNGVATFSGGQLAQMQTTEVSVGGDDILSGNEDNDVMLGGAGADTIAGNEGADILLGDNGAIDYGVDANLTTLDSVITTAPTIGGIDTITGDAGNDIVLGGAEGDSITGNVGDDILLGDHGQVSYTNGLLTQFATLNPENGGNDTIVGNEGADILVGGTANDTVNGNAGSDLIAGDNAKATFVAAVLQRFESIDGAIGGNDTITGNEDGDFILGGAGADNIDAGADLADDIVFGDNGTIVRADGTPEANDVYSIDALVGGKDTIVGGQGNDLLIGGLDDDQITGNEGNDVVLGDHGYLTRSAADQLEKVESLFTSNGGNDQIAGNAGDDIVIGGVANDTISGNTGTDFIAGDNAQVTLLGGVVARMETIAPTVGGDDVITGDEQPDFILGGSGADTINAGSDLANDVVLGDNGVIVRADGSTQANDVYSTDATAGGKDTITGGQGDDLLIGGLDDDQITANEGNDLVLGDHGAVIRNATDQLEKVESLFTSNGGNDQISGNAGDDIVMGGAANDTISGNTGTDFIAGDNAQVTLLGGVVARMETIAPTVGGNDAITGDEQSDFILGGSGADTIDAGSDLANDVVLGDNGVIVRADGSTQANDVYSTDATAGGKDTITGGQGDDLLIGGLDDDQITANEGNDLVLGDHGAVIRNATDQLEKVESLFTNNGGNDQISGDAGDDLILGGAANDTVTGNTGRDFIAGDNANVILTSSVVQRIETIDSSVSGNDTIDGNEDSDFILGGSGNDVITGGADLADDVLLGDNGLIVRADGSTQANDIVSLDTVHDGLDTIVGNGGNDIILGGGAADQIAGNEGNDLILGDHGYITRNATDVVELVLSTETDRGGNDVMTGDAGDDIILGGAANDMIHGNGGSDFITGDSAQVTLPAGVVTRIETVTPAIGGNDQIFGDDQPDFILGGAGHDVIDAGVDVANDVVLGDNGVIVRADGSSAANDIYSTDATIGGKDIITGHAGNDILIGGFDSDLITGDDGEDVLFGDHAYVTRNGSDVIEKLTTLFPGDGGDDLLRGNAGKDVVFGGAAHDVISGNEGEDILFGDNGLLDYSLDGNLNTLDLIESSDVATGGNDRIQGNDGDDVIFAGAANDFVSGNDGQDTIIGDNGRITLLGGQVRLIETIAPGVGGDDELSGGQNDDLIAGGFANDTIYGDSGDDRILGDNGRFDYAFAGDEFAPADADLSTLDVFTSTDPTLGGFDRIVGGIGSDTIFGGSWTDTISGDLDGDDRAKNWTVVGTGDFDGNGQTEVLLRNGLGATRLATVNGTEISEGDALLTVPLDWKVVGTGDFNGDGKTDIVWRNLISGEVQLWRMNGALLLSNSAIYNPGLDWTVSTVGDFNGDGLAELGWHHTAGLAALWTMNDGQVTSDRVYNLGAGWQPVATADFNGDGRSDLLWRNLQGQVAMWLMNGTEIISSQIYDAGTIWSPVAAADFTGDGKADILWRSLVATHYLWQMNGTQVLSDGFMQPISTIWNVAGVGNFNQDAKTDILWVDGSGNQYVTLMDGFAIAADGVTTPQPGQSLILSGDGWTAAAQGDFNGDGKLDTLWRNAIDGRNAIWTMDGTEVLNGGALLTVPSSWKVAGVADFDGDGKSDIFWRDSSGTNAVWYMDGAAIVNSTFLTTVTSDWQPIQAGDFNNDGKADILWQHTSGLNTLWLMNNGALIADKALPATGTEWLNLNAGDFNGDGHADLLWRNLQGQHVIWLMQNGAIIAADFLPAMSTDWGVVGYGDFNNDKRSDLVWRNGTGDYLLWAMNGLTRLSETPLVKANPDWTLMNIGDANGDGQMDLLWRDRSGMMIRWLNQGNQFTEIGVPNVETDDVILGDNGRVYRALPKERNFVSIDTAANQGDSDTIFGNEGDDRILGQQGNDVIYGEAGEDDITGGHNVIGGADGNDIIDGGLQSDVVLGDNGSIVRRPQGNFGWQRYAAPFSDVIRDVARFDDIDRIGGDDWIRGGSGDDILHGQRGNDLVEGNAGDDELYGQLGHDTLQGGEGQDTMLGDVGRIVRDYNLDGTPRRNANGSWHRDVMLTDVAQIADGTPQASQFQTPDMLLMGTAYDASGNKLAGQTPTYALNFFADGNDNLDGGAGDDSLFGQRGNDNLQGGMGNDYLEGNAGDDQISDIAGDDFIIGDDSHNLPPVNTELPLVTRGIHLIEQTAGLNLNLGLFGTVVTPNLTLVPQVNAQLLPVLTTVPNLFRDHSPLPVVGSLLQANGNSLRSLVAVIPDVVNHLDLLAGNDTIFAGAGLDTVVGDRYVNAMPMRTGNAGVDQNLDLLTRSLYQLNYDLQDLQLALTGTSGAAAQQLTLGADVIDAGGDRDLVMGDDALVMGPMQVQSPMSLTAVSQTLTDLRELVANFNGVVNGLLAPYTGGVMTQPYTLAIGNDQIGGGDGDDQLLADNVLMLTPVLNNFNYVKGSFWNYVLTGPDKAGRSNIRDFNLIVGNDAVAGGNGNDTIVGDYTNIVTPLVNVVPQTSAQRDQLQRDLDLLMEDVRTFLRDLHSTNHGIDYTVRNQANTVLAGNDFINGDVGNDLVIGDNSTMLLPIVSRQIDLNFSFSKGKLDTSDEAHNYFQGLLHSYDLVYRNPNVGITRVAEDTISGGDGNDILYGLRGIDQMTGNGGDDYVFGGAATDVISDSIGNNIIRSANPSAGDLLNTDVAVTQALLNLLTPTMLRYYTELDQERSNWKLDGRLEVDFLG
jgi:trimeric autotransporter adhesin